MIKYISIIVALAVMLVCSPTPGYADFCPPPTPNPVTHNPITSEFYNQFMNSEVEFTKIEIRYSMGQAPGYGHLRDQRLFMESNTDITDDMYWVNMTLTDLEFFIAHYSDWDVTPHFYHAGYTIEDDMLPIFQLVQANLDYYCNAEEYNGEESIEFINPWEMGIEFKNYVMLSFYPPDVNFWACPPLKSFVKGWHPGEAPPEELMPLIDYLEAEIIPIARLHPR